ncbi:MAG: metallophosphoesterase [Candidatus Aenigmarchaeota archaeon]|nr:metallophosphoesterase [Candidatus Aenigmarchaeota archaeon]MCX8179653.1 metallophosphoesterase [Candidatus Aenigmarchaeota archaeon]MDW8149572.1 metallophosphoesterase [Candidatus Aenigmarchaeota archaeon]
MIVAATSDIHSPIYYESFVKATDMMHVKPDVFLFAGDVVDRGNVDEYQKILNALFGKINCPIVACFGNSEFGKENIEKIKEKYRQVIFLEDETILLNIGEKNVGIVGSKGSLDRPTYWQSKNIPNIEEEYASRIEKIKKLLLEIRSEIKILLLHYTPTYKILEGENPNIYPELGSKKMEDVLLATRPNLVVCGHSHKGKKQVWIDGIPIFNVSFPLNEKIVIIDTEKDLKYGLGKFF